MKTYKVLISGRRKGKDLSFKYMLLARYQTDVEYYLGYGGRSPNVLYFKDEKRHIDEMIALWKRLPLKPNWLRATKLIEYKHALLGQNQ